MISSQKGCSMVRRMMGNVPIVARRNASSILWKHLLRLLASNQTLLGALHSDRTVLCSSIHKGAERCEAAWTIAAIQWRQARKASANNPLPSTEAIPYHSALSKEFPSSHRPCEPSSHPLYSSYLISCGWQKCSSTPVMDEQQSLLLRFSPD